MSIEPRKEDIEKIEKSMWAVYNDSGGNVAELIRTYADALAYQYELNRINFEILKDYYKALKKHNERKDT